MLIECTMNWNMLIVTWTHVCTFPFMWWNKRNYLGNFVKNSDKWNIEFKLSKRIHCCLTIWINKYFGRTEIIFVDLYWSFWILFTNLDKQKANASILGNLTFGLLYKLKYWGCWNSCRTFQNNIKRFYKFFWFVRIISKIYCQYGH